MSAKKRNDSLKKRQNLTGLEERDRRVLKLLVEEYIRHGRPVGSGTLVRVGHLRVSSATVRNSLAVLEAKEYVYSPHASAGRIPTVQGYRLFVNELLDETELPKQDIHLLNRSLAGFDLHRLAYSASNVLSHMTGFAGVVSLPAREALVLRQIRFLPLSGHRVLVILISEQNEVQNHILQMERTWSEDDLRRMANYLNEHLAGLEFSEARDRLMTEMTDARHDMDQVVRDACDLGREALVFQDAVNQDYLVLGQSNLLSWQELADIDKLRKLFSAFEERRDLLLILDQCMDHPARRVFIGPESGLAFFESMALVAAPYQTDGKILGVLGVIGPSRMPYGRVIPLVDVAANLLGRALSHRLA